MIDKSKYTPMMRQYLDIKENNKDSIVFFRLGDFYEMFFDDALLASKELEITLTGKSAGPKEKVPMCGVPHHSSSNYIARLIDKGYKVAIVEQTTEAGASKGIVQREVVKTITPGTNIDNLGYKNNFIASIDITKDRYNLSICDLSTGELYVSTNINENDVILGELLSLDIKELIVKSDIQFQLINTIKTNTNIMISINDNSNVLEYLDKLSDNIDSCFKENTNRLLNYLVTTQKKELYHLQNAKYLDNKDYLSIDYYSSKNLELITTLRDNTKQGTLLSYLNRTNTSLGHRNLLNWISRPLLNKETIIKRHNFIECLIENYMSFEELRDVLKEVYDLERIITRISINTCNGRDLIQLKKSLKILPELKKILNSLDSDLSKELHDKLDDFSTLYNILESALLEEQPISIKDGFIFKESYNKELDEIIRISNEGKSFIPILEEREKARTGIKKLKIGYTKVFGYYIEVSKSQTNLVKPEFNYIRKQTVASGERYITDDLKEKEIQILNAKTKRETTEYNLFVELRNSIKKSIPLIQNIAKQIAIIDTLYSLTKVAIDNNFVKPNIINSNKLNIIEGRHPVIESTLDEIFTPNDISITNDKNIFLLTGPNMSGKSTYMRQLAIIVILNQIGSFVPAIEANLPIYDKIFTRIGSSDDSFRGQSTFMTEMLEANNAISNATSNSLILFDELGRGTSTYDGLAISQAILEYINNNIKCTTIFSTHYHELTSLEDSLSNIKNIYVSATENNSKLTFLHKVKDGKSDKSYGINVASLAKLPNSIISRASYILEHFEKQSIVLDKDVSNVKEDSNCKINNIINNIDTNNITPLDALNLLIDLKNKIK